MRIFADEFVFVCFILLLFFDVDVSAFWAFLYFVGFCYLTNAWGKSDDPPEGRGVNQVQAAIAFSFFAIFTWVN